MTTIQKGERVLSQGGEEGSTTGTSRSCTMEGCRGIRIGVRWPDGKTTWPCTKGMIHDGDGWRII